MKLERGTGSVLSVKWAILYYKFYFIELTDEMRGILLIDCIELFRSDWE